MAAWDCKHADLSLLGADKWWCADCGALALRPEAAGRSPLVKKLRAYAQWVGYPGGACLVFVRPRDHGYPPSGFGMRMAAEQEEARYAAWRVREGQSDGEM